MNPAGPSTNRANSNYYVDPGASRVTAWSTARIPFGPKAPDWRLAFRNELKSAISGLSPVDGKVLYATYRSVRSPTREYVDVENLLIYNVLGDTSNTVTRNGLAFERFYGISRDCPVQLSSPALHQYEYSLVDDGPSSIEEQDGRLLATLSFRLTASALGSCASVWYAAKTGDVTLVRRRHEDQPWAISITIDAPSSPAITCSKIVKHLVDGIASALQYYEGSDIDCVSGRLDTNMGLRYEGSTKALLEDSSHALLGASNLLYRYGESSGVKWNPKDEYCTYCSIRCRYGLTVEGLKIACRIFDTDQRGSPI